MDSPYEQYTRLIWPFRFSDTARTEASLQALADLRVTGDDGSASGERRTWLRDRPHPEYFEEALPGISELLTGADRSKEELGGYFRLDPALSGVWFKQKELRVVLDGDKDARWWARIERNGQAGAAGESQPPAHVIDLWEEGVEIFLGSSGCGAFVVSVTRKTETTSAAQVADWNYHLSHLKYRVPRFRLVHPETDPDAFVRMPAATSARIAPRPLPSATFPERIGHRGGAFTLLELRDFLLAPIYGLEGFAALQEQFHVFTVVRFGREADFSDRGVRDRLGPSLAGLAQIEESSHAPAASDSLGVPNEILNSKHWAAVSYLGAAHFVADQWPREETVSNFDQDRCPTILRKYFAAYLTAVAQRVTLQGFQIRAAELAKSGMGHEVVGSADALKRAVLIFSAVHNLMDVSRRPAVNRFYRLARSAQMLPETAASTHQAIGDLAAAVQAAAQIRTERSVRLLEVLSIALAAAGVVQGLSSAFGFGSAYGGGAAVACGAAAGVVAWLQLQAGRMAPWILIASVILVLALFVVVGWLFYQVPPTALTLPAPPYGFLSPGP